LNNGAAHGRANKWPIYSDDNGQTSKSVTDKNNLKKFCGFRGQRLRTTRQEIFLFLVIRRLLGGVGISTKLTMTSKIVKKNFFSLWNFMLAKNEVDTT